MIFKPKMCNLDLFLMFLVIFTLGYCCCCWCASRESRLRAAAWAGPKHSACFDSATIFMQKLFTAGPVEPGKPDGQPAATCFLLLSSFWAARLQQGAGQAKVYGYKWSPHFLTAAFPNNCRTKNNNFSADVIFISTYVAAWGLSQRSARLPPSSPRVCVCTQYMVGPMSLVMLLIERAQARKYCWFLLLFIGIIRQHRTVSTVMFISIVHWVEFTLMLRFTLQIVLELKFK